MQNSALGSSLIYIDNAEIYYFYMFTISFSLFSQKKKEETYYFHPNKECHNFWDLWVFKLDTDYKMWPNTFKNDTLILL